MNTPFSGWIASLSNGETVFETKEVEGELSPWQSLKQRCKEENLNITQLRLQLSGLTFIGIPNADGYAQCWKHYQSVFNPDKPPTVMRGIGSVIGDKVYLTWVDNYGNIRQEVEDYKNVEIHCIMKK